MTNEQIKKLESRLNEIERKINERLERMADDDLIEESARDLIAELEKIRKDLLNLITKPSKICEYVDPPEDNQRIMDKILQIERLYEVLGLENVTHLSTIKDYLIPPVVLNWETRWRVTIEGLRCRFHVVAKDIPLELDQFPPQDNIVTLKSNKTIEFEFIDADFHVDEPHSTRLFDVTPEKKLLEYEVEIAIECVPGTTHAIKDISLKLLYTNPDLVGEEVFPINCYSLYFTFAKKELYREEKTYFLFNGWEFPQTNTFAIKHIESSGYSADVGGMHNYDEKITLSYKS